MIKMSIKALTNTALIFFALLTTACGGARKKVDGQSELEEPRRIEPIHVQATRDGERLNLDAYDASGLFDRASAELRAGRCDRAIEIYTKLVGEFPDSDLTPPSLYNTGLCNDDLERYTDAASAYNKLLDLFPGSFDATDALFRLAGSYEKLEAWDSVIATLDKLLYERDDLDGIEKIEAMARKGSALLSLDRDADAKLILEEAVRLYRAGRGISPSDSVFHYSMAQFKVGEIVHREMRAIELPQDESILQETLEKKAQLLLDAQRLYTKVIRIGHSHWASAAAYRIGSLYHHLWVDMLAAPPPEDLSQEEKEIYTEILRKKIRVLLKKAVVQWERTLKLAVRLGLDSEWIDSTKSDLGEIRRVLALEEVRDTSVVDQED